MFVKIYGQNMEVVVDDNGTFSDKATHKFSARTLSSLEKKMLEAFKPQGNVKVENEETGKQGVVINLANGRYDWNRQYAVKWEDGTQTTTYPRNLRKPTTPEQRQHLQELQQAVDSTEAAYEAAVEAKSAFLEEISITETLKNYFKKG